MTHASAQPASLDLPADLTLLGTFFDVIAVIRRITDNDIPAEAKVAGISRCLDERLPGPAGGMPTLLPPGDDDSPVGQLARRMAAGELFTSLAGELAGEPVTARVVRDGLSDMTPGERRHLVSHIDGRMRCLRRRGELRTATGNRLCARVTSLVIPGRVREAGGAGALAELETADRPLGAVLEPLGLVREPLWTWPYCSDDVVINSCARLWLPDPAHGGASKPVGLATEKVMRLDWWAA
jgi:hypothetical protein